MAKKKGKKDIDKDSIINYNTDSSNEVVFEDVDIEEASAEKIKKLQKKLKACLAEKQEYLNGWQRSKADLVNSRKEEEKRRAELVKFAEENLLLEMLPALDSFDMAFANTQSWERIDKNWRIGVEHIHTQLLDVLKQHNLVLFDPIGEIFDPTQHDSIESVVTKKKSDDHKIIEVLQKGYILNEKVVRPAKVKVTKYKK